MKAEPSITTPVPTPEEAMDIAKRFIDRHFDNAGEKPRISIPADPRRDDDLRLIAFIENYSALLAALEAQEQVELFAREMATMSDGSPLFTQGFVHMGKLKDDASKKRHAALAAARGKEAP